MITEQNRSSIETAFLRSLKEGLVRDASDACEIVSIERVEQSGQAQANLLLLTLSSFIFRLMMLFRIVESPATCAYFVRSSNHGLDEHFSEVANMCGGALRRELSASFAHLAMSTPTRLSNQCMALLQELQPQFVSSYLITINDSVRLQATLCLCGSVPLEIELGADTAEAERNSGELELF